MEKSAQHPDIDHSYTEDVTRNRGRRKGSLDVTFETRTRVWRKATFGSPLVGIGYTGAGLGYLGYKAGPWISRQLRRLLSPGRGLTFEDEDEYEEWKSKQRKLWGWTLGGLGALGALALSYKPKSQDKGLLNYSNMEKDYNPDEVSYDPSLEKEASLYSDSMPLSQCMDSIMETDKLTVGMKTQALNLLSSFDAPPSAPITGGDLVGQAIATGQSAAAGAAIGYLTANVLGLPNPKSTAILGAVANTLGVRPALVGSVVFGE